MGFCKLDFKVMYYFKKVIIRLEKFKLCFNLNFFELEVFMFFN